MLCGLFCEGKVIKMNIYLKETELLNYSNKEIQSLKKENGNL